MTSILTAVGLRAAAGSLETIPNHGPAFLMFNFLFAYGILSSRTMKQYYGIDRNVCPREDLSKYGETAVRDGKLTRKQLDMFKRNESAHANAVENYALFVAGVLFASYSGVRRESINAACLSYTLVRILYGGIYILIDHPKWSSLRAITWWMGNGSCIFPVEAWKILS